MTKTEMLAIAEAITGMKAAYDLMRADGFREKMDQFSNLCAMAILAIDPEKAQTMECAVDSAAAWLKANPRLAKDLRTDIDVASICIGYGVKKYIEFQKLHPAEEE